METVENLKNTDKVEVKIINDQLNLVTGLNTLTITSNHSIFQYLYLDGFTSTLIIPAAGDSGNELTLIASNEHLTLPATLIIPTSATSITIGSLAILPQKIAVIKLISLGSRWIEYARTILP